MSCKERTVNIEYRLGKVLEAGWAVLVSVVTDMDSAIRSERAASYSTITFSKRSRLH